MNSKEQIAFAEMLKALILVREALENGSLIADPRTCLLGDNLGKHVQLINTVIIAIHKAKGE